MEQNFKRILRSSVRFTTNQYNGLSQFTANQLAANFRVSISWCWRLVGLRPVAVDLFYHVSFWQVFEIGQKNQSFHLSFISLINMFQISASVQEADEAFIGFSYAPPAEDMYLVS